MNFGHTEPKICIPYGALAEINCNNFTFSIIESVDRCNGYCPHCICFVNIIKIES